MNRLALLVPRVALRFCWLPRCRYAGPPGTLWQRCCTILAQLKGSPPCATCWRCLCILSSGLPWRQRGPTFADWLKFVVLNFETFDILNSHEAANWLKIYRLTSDNFDTIMYYLAWKRQDPHLCMVNNCVELEGPLRLGCVNEFKATSWAN